LCVNFFQRNAGAARKFYLYVQDHLSVKELGKWNTSFRIFCVLVG